ncbi:unnamed protein product [Lactuca saligna]|uniref:PurT/PurK-like preATP-grasp domain-containing protein n=1 Tax=Lactuca saligna TaxID=75948 RepID=A0AA35ZLX6_LACSI|nr:unnamed protein product [Lactuca saligna]
MSIKVNILDPMVNCPASSIYHHHMVGSYDNSTTVEEFAKRCGILTDEIEHVDVDTLEKLEKQGVDCQPKASTIRIIQVLDVEFYNVKALYRRAQAYMETYDYELTELDIKKALEADPQIKEVNSIHKTLKQLEAQSNKRDTKLYTNMFAQMANDYSIQTKRLKIEKVEKNEKDGVMGMELEKGKWVDIEGCKLLSWEWWPWSDYMPHITRQQL